MSTQDPSQPLFLGRRFKGFLSGGPGKLPIKNLNQISKADGVAFPRIHFDERGDSSIG